MQLNFSFQALNINLNLLVALNGTIFALNFGDDLL